MAGYGYAFRGYSTYDEVAPNADGWSEARYGSYTPEHVCRPVLIDADGKKTPIIVCNPNHNAHSYVAKVETIVEHVRIPWRDYAPSYGSPPKVAPERDYGYGCGSAPKVAPERDYGYGCGSAPKVAPVRDYGYGCGSAPKAAEPVKDYGYTHRSQPKLEPAKDYGYWHNSPPTVEPVKNYGSRYSPPPKVEPVEDYGCRWSSPPKVDPVKDYGYKVEPVKDRGYKAEPMKAYTFKPEPEKDYEYKDEQPKDCGYKVGPVKGYDRPPEVEEFITKVQTDASRPNIGPSNAPYRYQTPQSNGQNGITGYGDKNDSSSKDWRKPSGNTTRNDNYDDYYRKNDTAVESPMITTQGWARPTPLLWAAPPTRDTTLGTPTSDIATAMENLKKAAKALSVNDAPPSSPFAVPISTVPKRDTISTPPKKDTYAETIDSREAARRYGNVSSLSTRPQPTAESYKTTIDSKKAAEKYGGAPIPSI